jgi:hypothetical protein
MIACWFYRKFIADCTDANRALPDSAQRHLQTCPACRKFFDSERELTQRLVAGAKSHLKSPSPFLHAKIMAALDRHPQSAAPSRQFLAPVWATALVIAALGLFSIYVMRDAQQPSGRSSHSANSPVPRVPPENPVPMVTGQNLLNWTTKLDQPLESEMQSVVADAKAAIQLLAQNFLPENAREPSAR